MNQLNDGVQIVALPRSNKSGLTDKPNSASPARKRAPRVKTDNLPALEAFVPSAELLARLRAKCPTVAHKLTLLSQRFTTEPYWRDHFQRGRYADPAKCFENFVLREEGYALDRPGAAKRRPDMLRTALRVGSAEAERFYDAD